jgi:hypothetical protein
MSFLRKLFGPEKENETATPPEEIDAPCPHVTLIPRWESNPDDMGNEAKADRFTCDGCDAEFSGDEGRALLAKEKERVEQVVGEG